MITIDSTSLSILRSPPARRLSPIPEKLFTSSTTFTSSTSMCNATISAYMLACGAQACLQLEFSTRAVVPILRNVYNILPDATCLETPGILSTCHLDLCPAHPFALCVVNDILWYDALHGVYLVTARDIGSMAACRNRRLAIRVQIER